MFLEKVPYSKLFDKYVSPRYRKDRNDIYTVVAHADDDTSFHRYFRYDLVEAHENPDRDLSEVE